MSGDRLEVSVTFDAAKGYVAMVPDLAEPITALSLAVLRRRIEERLIGEDVEVRLVLDRAARWSGIGGGGRRPVSITGHQQPARVPRFPRG
jgi:hypothetical protein